MKVAICRDCGAGSAGVALGRPCPWCNPPQLGGIPEEEDR